MTPPLGAFKASILGAAGVSSDYIILLATQTASGDSSLAFTSLIDSTYKEYVFSIENWNPSDDGSYVYFQAGAAYNTTITSGAFRSENSEGSGDNFGYAIANAQHQGTAEQIIYHETDADSDSCVSGDLHLFIPSDTTYVKTWYCKFQGTKNANTSMEVYTSGVFNTTSALTQVRFKPSSGTFDGTIRMYGVVH